MKNVIAIIALFCTVTAFGHKNDSIGTKVKNDKVYILHKIEKGDGLYSLSKRYGVSLKSIVSENPGCEQVIKMDQILLIPTNLKPEMKEKRVDDFFSGEVNVVDVSDNDRVKSETETVSTFAKYHAVQPGQTLYAISKMYNTSIEMIMTLNNLTSPEIAEGQRLLVQDGKAEFREKEKVDVEETDYVKIKQEMKEKKYADSGFDTEVETNSTSSSSGYSIKVEKLVEYNIEKIEETGTSAIGSEKVPDNKNFATHFNAPIGTVIMVTNPTNKKTVFVKVVGNFTKQENSSEIIRLSKLSAEHIGLENKQQVLLSYAR